MYLSFMDTWYNDNVIDEKFSCDSSIVEKADRNLKYSVGFNYNIWGYFEIFEL